MGSIQMPAVICHSALPESSCGYLLQELKLIWDEVGDNQLERERILFELEQECLEVYKRKVDSANINRVRLHQQLADSEAEFTHLLVSLGERSFPGRPEKMAGTLRQQLDSITPALQEMRLRKEERIKQLLQVQSQIQKISAEISGNSNQNISPVDMIVNDNDLSLKKLEEYQSELQRLHKEKNDRLLKMEEYRRTVHNLASTMGMDSSNILTKVHPSLDGSTEARIKNISDLILERLESTIEFLKEEKKQRIEKLRKLGKALLNLWRLMDTPLEDQRLFVHVQSFISATEASISKPGSLALDVIQQAELEVKRLDQLKANRLKELFLRKQKDLEEICKTSHMEIPSQSHIDHIMNLINSGEMDHSDLLTSMDEQILKASEEAFSRKTIMEKVEKWIAACAEEHWLDEYNMDRNRYSVSRVAHKNLMRAERARITVNRIPDLIDLLMSKTKKWEQERKKVFLYDKVPLFAILEKYNSLRKEKEEDKHRQREKKKAQSKMVVEQESLYRSRRNTSNFNLMEKSLNSSFGSTVSHSKRVSLVALHQSPNKMSTTRSPNSARDSKKAQRRNMVGHYNDVSHDYGDATPVISSSS